jgi:hypothetical protein
VKRRRAIQLQPNNIQFKLFSSLLERIMMFMSCSKRESPDQYVTHYLDAHKLSRTSEPGADDNRKVEEACEAFLEYLRRAVEEVPGQRVQQGQQRQAQRLGRESHYRIHQHFGLTSSTLDILDTNFPAGKNHTTIGFKSSFQDTPEYDLAHRNLWLVNQQGGPEVLLHASNTRQEVGCLGQCGT